MDSTTIENWVIRIERITVEVRHLCAPLDHEAFNWKPNPQSWSAAQILKHLIIVNSDYFPIVRSVQNGTYKISWTRWIPFFPQMMGKLILKYTNPENKTKVKTFRAWEPTSSALPLSILDDFIRLQDELKTLIRSSAESLAKKVIIGSPANRNMTFSLENAFHIITVHEERHLVQLQQVINLRVSQKYS